MKKITTEYTEFLMGMSKKKAEKKDKRSKAYGILEIRSPRDVIENE
jgi:hypothetical protein